MPLAPGSRLGPYEVLAPLGAGGMGEVYRARDTRLDRAVAIKVLPPHLTEQPEARARFEREARAVSALNHPHICTLYDIGRDGGVDFLVMEHLEGETLAHRLERGALPPEETLRLAVQIADALDRAHRRGIIHRDLKPANIMLTKGGAKLLDFGLAKQEEPVTRDAGLTASPTRSRLLTAEGSIVGTLQYMAPEQLEGKEADARTDLFAFGAVLYEMTTGRRAFEASGQASLIAAIMSAAPPEMASRAPAAPPALERAVRTCLAKDPDERWQSAGDLRRELEWIARGGAGVTARPAPARRSAREQIAWVLVAALAGVVVTRGVARRLGPGPVEPRAIHAAILPPEGTAFTGTSLFAGPVEVSPDGTMLAFVARRGEERGLLWVRSLAEAAARPLAGTEGAVRAFWSPDSRFLGFFADGRLKKIPAAGGPIFTLAEVSDPRGGTWSREGTIVFAPGADGPLLRVPAEGGQPGPATALDEARGERTHRYPWFLPDGRRFLYLARGAGAGAGREPAIFIGALDSAERRLLLNAASNAIHASGHILFVREKTLVAQPFDAARRELSGEAMPVAADVRMDERFSRGVFSASQTGVLAYQTGEARSLSRLVWLDRTGTPLGSLGAAENYFSSANPEIAPDGTRVLAPILDLETGLSSIWMHDLARGRRARFTLDPGDHMRAIWSPDGSRVAYHESEAKGSSLLARPATGGGAAERLLATTDSNMPQAWSPDGRLLLYGRSRGSEPEDLWLLPLAGAAKPRPFLESDAEDTNAQFAPDGRWVAYQSDESGKREVYVVPFPGPGGKWQVSTGGGVEPRWRADGRELYYFAPDNRLLAVQVRTDGAAFELGDARALFQAQEMGFAWRYAVSVDGSRFLVSRPVPEPSLAAISLVLDWPAALPGSDPR
jgi:hypothetical protein